MQYSNVTRNFLYTGDNAVTLYCNKMNGIKTYIGQSFCSLRILQCTTAIISASNTSL